MNGHPSRKSRIYLRFCCNSRKTMRLPPQLEMRPDSPALHAEQFQFPNQTGKETWFAWCNSNEFPRTPSQVLNDTNVTKGMWNCLEYPKSTRDDARLPCIGSRAVHSSPSYKTGGLSYFRQLQRFPETTFSNLEEHQFQHRNSRYLHGCHIISRREWIPRILLKR